MSHFGKVVTNARPPTPSAQYIMSIARVQHSTLKVQLSYSSQINNFLTTMETGEAILAQHESSKMDQM